jgi:hypothetical protein
LRYFRHRAIRALGITCRLASKRPVKSSAKVRLGYFGREFNKLGIGELLPKVGEQFVAHIGGSSRHGYGKIKYQFLDRAKYGTVFIISKVPQLFFGNADCSALGRA